MAVNINHEEGRVFITVSAGCARSGISLYLDEIKEEDLLELLKIKRERNNV